MKLNSSYEPQNGLKDYLAYLGVGIFSVLLALYLATQFIKKAASQEDDLGPPQNSPFSPADSAPRPSATAKPSDKQGDDIAELNKLAQEDLKTFLEPYIYDAQNRRDPFQPYNGPKNVGPGEFSGPLMPLQRFDLDEINLIGIMWDVKTPKAMFLDPNKQIHVLGRDDRIGRNNGYVAVIREGEVVIVEALNLRGETVYTTRVVKIAR